jgi:undecaprenyl diphosphate synthase
VIESGSRRTEFCQVNAAVFPQLTSAENPLPPALDIPPERLPAHVAMIMDGNGRWAERLDLPRAEGHRRGAITVGEIVRECRRLGIAQLTLYCLSNENWKRPAEELEFLMALLQQFMIESRRDLLDMGIRLQIIGRKDRLPETVLTEMHKTLEMTRHFSEFRLCLAIDYGSRQELVAAMKQIALEVARGELDPDSIDEELVSSRLYTSGMPDPDLLIRTAGEMRISNYLLWQISYAEIWVTDRCWPEFRIADFHQALRDYASRKRRFGGLPDEGEPFRL